VQVGGALVEEALRIGDRLVVDRGPVLGKEVIQDEPGFQVTDLLIQIVSEVALNGRDGSLSCLIRDRDRRLAALDREEGRGVRSA